MKFLDAVTKRIAGAKRSAASAIESARTAADAATNAAEALNTLRAQIADLEQQVIDAERAPVPREDVATRARLMVEERRAQASRQWQFFCYTDHAIGAVNNRHPEHSQIPREIDWLTALSVEDPSRAEALLVKLYDHVTADHADAIGQPAADRPTLLAELRQSLTLLESEEERLVDNMQSAGLSVTHRQKTIARREETQSRSVQQEQQIPARKTREVIIDEQHRSRAVVHSNYLSGSRLRNDG